MHCSRKSFQKANFLCKRGGYYLSLGVFLAIFSQSFLRDVRNALWQNVHSVKFSVNIVDYMIIQGL